MKQTEDLVLCGIVQRGILGSPRRLTMTDVNVLRLALNRVKNGGTTAEEFQTSVGCPAILAPGILSLWELAQAKSWHAKTLESLFGSTFENRDLVAQRVRAALRSGIVPIPCSPEAGLKWLESEGVLVAHAAEWIKANLSAQVPGPVVPSSETKKQRQDRRLAACEAAGLTMRRERLPDGVGRLADIEGVTRQAFSTDVKAAMLRRENAKREGSIHRCA